MNREKLKEYPKTDKFECIDTIGVPHPYCITPKHVAVAADHHSGILDDGAVEDAERRGAKCGVRGCNLGYREHETAILVQVDDDRELKDVPGLKEYLLSIKERAEADKVAGFAFKQKK